MFAKLFPSPRFHLLMDTNQGPSLLKHLISFTVNWQKHLLCYFKFKYPSFKNQSHIKHVITIRNTSL